MLKYKKSLELDDFLPESRVVIEEYYCTLCKGIYKDPTIDDCGHVYCRDCLSTYMETSLTCPVSSNPLDKNKINSIKFIASILDKQFVYCKKRFLNCQWVGKLFDLEAHLKNECLKNEVKCRNLDCKKFVLREEEEAHYLVCEHKRVPCKDCGNEILLSDQFNHSKVCTKYKVDCYQKCGELIERGKLDFHAKSICENSIVQCIYYAQGCLEKILKKNFSAHLTEFNDKHQILIFKKFEDFDIMFNSRVTDLENVYDKFTKKIVMLENIIIDKKNTRDKLKMEKNVQNTKNEKNPQISSSNGLEISANNVNMNNKEISIESKDKEKLEEKNGRITEKIVKVEKIENIDKQEKLEKMEKIEKSNKDKDIKYKKNQAKIASGEPIDDTLSSISLQDQTVKDKLPIKNGINGNNNKTTFDKKESINKETNSLDFKHFNSAIKPIKPFSLKDTSDLIKAEMELSKEKVLMGLKRKRENSKSYKEDMDELNDGSSNIMDMDSVDIDLDLENIEPINNGRKSKISQNGLSKPIHIEKKTPGKPGRKPKNYYELLNKAESKEQTISRSCSPDTEHKEKNEEEKNTNDAKSPKKRGNPGKKSNNPDNSTPKSNSNQNSRQQPRITRSQEQEPSLQKDDFILDMVSSSKGITINSNSAICSANSKNEHRCVFANIILNDTEKKWQVKVVSLKNWLGVGVSLKEVVICNKFKFVYSNPLFNHGTYMISSNGISWNSNNQKENNTKIKNFPGIKVGDVITLNYNAKKSELEFNIGEFEYVMHDVVSIRAFLVPTVVFLSLGDEVSFESL